MPVAYADAATIQSMINSIINANEPGLFAATIDTGASSDKRYSDAMITSARRMSALRVIDAIASNLSHPFWGELATKVAVTHGAVIPACFGEIGVPEIAPYSDVVASAIVKSIEGPMTATFGSITIIAPGIGFVDPDDIGRRLLVSHGDVLYIDELITAVTDTDTCQIAAPSDYNLSAALVQVLGTDVTVAGPYETGIEASAAEIDSYRADPVGSYTNMLGEGSLRHDQIRSSSIVRSPVTCRYSTENGYIKFTGYACRIPMIQQPVDTAASNTLADGSIPVQLAPTVVRLAIGLLVKEGDTLARIAAMYAAQGEIDLAQIKAGASSVAPIDITRAVQLYQRFRQ